MQQFCFTASDEQDTRRLGQALACHLPQTATVALEGTLVPAKLDWSRRLRQDVVSIPKR